MKKATVVANLDALGQVIGSIKAMEEMDSPAYINSLIKVAHGKASNAFDIAAAATAQAKGNMSHMYEYGVAGITRGPVKFPTGAEPGAHLYVHTLDTRHDGATVNYVFRPAVTRNPRWTSKDTGVPSKNLKHLKNRKYVFRNVAYVTEMGQTVQIQPREGGRFLFIPWLGGRSPGALKGGQSGFTFYNAETKGPLKIKMRKNTGAFSSFWALWWAGEGTKMLTKSMTEDVTKDFESIMNAAARKSAIEKTENVLNGNVGLKRNVSWGRTNTLRILNQRARRGL